MSYLLPARNNRQLWKDLLPFFQSIPHVCWLLFNLRIQGFKGDDWDSHPSKGGPNRPACRKLALLLSVPWARGYQFLWLSVYSSIVLSSLGMWFFTFVLQHWIFIKIAAHIHVHIYVYMSWRNPLRNKWIFGCFICILLTKSIPFVSMPILGAVSDKHC